MSQGQCGGGCGGVSSQNPPKMKPPAIPPQGQGTKPQGPPQKEITGKERDELSRLSEGCYEGLHRPLVVKVDGVEEIWYICQECLDRWVKDHPHLQEQITGFKR